MITIDGALLLLQIFFLCSGSSCWSKKSVFHHTPTRCTVFFRSYRSSLLHSINVLPSYFILCARRFPVQLSFRFRSLPSPAFHFQSRFFAIQSLRDPATGRGAITYIPGVARLTFIRIYFQSRNEGELSEEPVVVRPEELPSFPDVFIEPIWSGKLIHEQKGKCMIVKPRFSSIRVSKVMPKLAFQVSRECENWWTQSDCLALLSSKPLPICYSSIHLRRVSANLGQCILRTRPHPFRFISFPSGLAHWISQRYLPCYSSPEQLYCSLNCSTL